MQVLLVEDEDIVRALLAEELREAGLHVIEATNADEAWTYLESGAPVALVFSDVQMPGSMNGLELAQRLRPSRPTTPVIITSGGCALTLIEELRFFLPKPYDVQCAVSLVLQTLGLARPVEH